MSILKYILFVIVVLIGIGVALLINHKNPGLIELNLHYFNFPEMQSGTLVALSFGIGCIVAITTALFAQIKLRASNSRLTRKLTQANNEIKRLKGEIGERA